MVEVPRFHLAVVVLVMMLQVMKYGGETVAVQSAPGNLAPGEDAGVRAIIDTIVVAMRFIISIPATFFQLMTVGAVPGMPGIVRLGFTVYSAAVLGVPAGELLVRMLQALAANLDAILPG